MLEGQVISMNYNIFLKNNVYYLNGIIHPLMSWKVQRYIIWQPICENNLLVHRLLLKKESTLLYKQKYRELVIVGGPISTFFTIKLTFNFRKKFLLFNFYFGFLSFKIC